MERDSEYGYRLNIRLLHETFEFLKVAPLAGIEPATFRLGGKRSSY